MNKVKYLFSDPERIRENFKEKFIYLFLDYDGTLAPIVRTPDKAVMPESTKDLLRQLSKMPNCKIAVVSGRALQDVSERVGLKNIVYVGNHGFEIKGSKVKFKSPVPQEYRRTLDAIKTGLKKSLSSIAGVLIEDKGFSLSVHYRLADKKNIDKIKAGFYVVLALYEAGDNIAVRAGKKVLEIRPSAAWDKGRTVSWLLSRHRSAMRGKKKRVLPVYIGDDLTDEDAFGFLKDKGMTIFVGRPRKTKARFYLKDTPDVAKFLKEILKNINPGALCQKKR